MPLKSVLVSSSNHYSYFTPKYYMRILYQLTNVGDIRFSQRLDITKKRNGRNIHCLEYRYLELLLSQTFSLAPLLFIIVSLINPSVISELIISNFGSLQLFSSAILIIFLKNTVQKCGLSNFNIFPF